MLSVKEGADTTAESRGMIENTDRAQLSRENCFLRLNKSEIPLHSR